MTKFPFYNPILGFFKTEEEMQKEISEAGLIKENGQWHIPMSLYTRDYTERNLYKRGDKYWGVSKVYLDYQRTRYGREKHAEENSEALDNLLEQENPF